MTERIIIDANGRKHITTEPLLHPTVKQDLQVKNDQLRRELDMFSKASALHFAERDQLRKELAELQAKAQEQTLQIISLIGQEIDAEQAEPVAKVVQKVIKGRRGAPDIYKYDFVLIDPALGPCNLYATPPDTTALLRQALEALELGLPRLAPYGEQDWLDSKAAITAIRKHLGEV
jgi:hypothetical protein